MDPVSVLGIAAAAAQFIQFSGSLVSKSREIYALGSCLSNVECERATQRLVELTEKIQRFPSQRSDVTCKQICDNCLNLSKELLRSLKEVQIKDGTQRKKWKSFRQALKAVSSKSKIDAIAARLSGCRNELNSHLLFLLEYVLID